MARGPSWVDDLDQLLRTRFKPGDTFSLDDAYTFREQLVATRPNAANVEARIRDALQQMRHRKDLEFVAKGRYRLTR